jgi:hypothetical protein
MLHLVHYNVSTYTCIGTIVFGVDRFLIDIKPFDFMYSQDFNISFSPLAMFEELVQLWISKSPRNKENVLLTTFPCHPFY